MTGKTHSAGVTSGREPPRVVVFGHLQPCILVAMLGIDQRVLRMAWTVFLLALALGVVYEIRYTLIIFALALFLAHLLAPVVDLVARFVLRRVSRTLALAVVYLALMGALAAIAVPVASKIAEQAAALAGKLPDAVKQDPLGSLPLPHSLEPMRPRLTEFLRQRFEDLNRDVLPLLSSASRQILTGIGNVLSLILIPILSFFFLKDGPGMRAAIVESFDVAHQPLVEGMISDLHVLLAQYIRALVLLSISSFLVTFGFLSIAGTPYAILLAGIAAILEFLPVAGPLIAAAVILLVAAFSGYPHLLWIAVFLVLFRIFQDYVLSPYLMSANVRIHPLLILFGVAAGEQLAGIPGMFFSVPVIAALRVVLARVRRRQYVP